MDPLLSNFLREQDKGFPQHLFSLSRIFLLYSANQALARPSAKAIMTSSLEQLKATGTTVVCDSGDFNTISKYQPQDATTNPSLILAASKKPEYAQLMDVAVEYGRKHGKDKAEQVDAALDRLLVEFGREILKIIPGRVSTEVDAALSFDTERTIEKALHIIDVSDQGKICRFTDKAAADTPVLSALQRTRHR